MPKPISLYDQIRQYEELLEELVKQRPDVENWINQLRRKYDLPPIPR